MFQEKPKHWPNYFPIYFYNESPMIRLNYFTKPSEWVEVYWCVGRRKLSLCYIHQRAKLTTLQVNSLPVPHSLRESIVNPKLGYMHITEPVQIPQSGSPSVKEW